MEYLSGITLRDLLTEHKILTPEQTLDILEAVLSGLAAAHKSGIVHRDLKPENVLLADDGRIKISDFGLARAVSANTATGAALLGTIAYLSPELVTRGIADARSDIYAAGIMMYEMLAGEQPFRGEQPMQIAYQHANDSVPTPSTKNPNVPAELDELVLWATAREPNERPRDARVMLEQVVETQSQLRTALPTGATAVIQRTTVMPAALALSGTGDQTTVIRSAQPAAAAPPLSDATAALTQQANKRHSRAWWWIVLFIVLAGGAGGAGWFLGPGSQVEIPTESVIGQTPDAAAAAITEAGLTSEVAEGQVYSPTVPAGAVAETDPSAGSVVARDTVVSLKISQGPQPIAVPEFGGLSEDDAKTLAEETGFVPTDSERRFFDAPEGTVITVFGVADDGSRITLATGDQYYDQRPVTFLLSAGTLPTVVNLPVDQAVSALAAVDVTGNPVAEREFNTDIPDGNVIRMETATPDGSVSPTDGVNLIVSKGPDLVDIPDVVGETIPDATTMLVEAGFTVRVDTNVPTPFRSQAEVQSVSPDDDQAVRGSEITIVSRYEL
jgi:serine/threonine-protein kinase